MSVVAIFSTPERFSDIGKLIWIFVTYNLCNAVFNTLIGVSKGVLLKRTTVSDSARIKTLTMTSLLVSLAAIVIAVVLPLLIAKNNTPGGWRMLAIGFAVIGCISTAITFFCCVEFTEGELVELGLEKAGQGKETKLSFRDYGRAIIKNKYMVIYVAQYAVAMLAMGLFNGAGTYYYSTNLGDLTLMSAVSMVSFLSYPLYPIYPKIIAKIGPINFTRATFLIGAIGFAARAMVGNNLVLLCVSSFFAGFLLTGINLVGQEITIQCMDYSYLKNGIRAEGIYMALTGFTYKAAMGVSSAIMGFLLGIANYDGAQSVQPTSAHIMINLMFNIIPAVVGVLMFFTFKSIRVGEENQKLRAALQAEEE